MRGNVFRKFTVVGASLVALMAALPATAAEITTADDLLNAADNAADWITVHRTYDGQRYSPLDQINTGNVANLRLAFTFALGGSEGAGPWTYSNSEATPRVEDGIIYMPNG